MYYRFITILSMYPMSIVTSINKYKKYELLYSLVSVATHHYMYV